ncbi:hypothetical protein Hdeb2414_s0007g00237861 [Helianthus debilis subsp. tardiflorus]
MHTRTKSGSKKSDDTLKSQNLLKDPYSEICKFTDPEIQNLKSCFPPKTIFRSFDSSVRSVAVSETLICFPALSFLVRFLYPFHYLTHNVFEHTGISNRQAMPMLWRALFTREGIIEKEGLQFDLPESAYLYTLVTHVSNLFLFKSKPHQPIPVLKTTRNDSSWRNQFFFIRRDSIPEGDTLPLRWISKVKNLQALLNF